MFGRTNNPNRRLTRRQKRVMASIGGLILLAFVGIGIWSVAAPDSFGRSGNGCVNVTVPSSMGGATLHYCGDAARAFCRSVTEGQTQLARYARPQCQLAGLPVSTASPSSSP